MAQLEEVHGRDEKLMQLQEVHGKVNDEGAFSRPKYADYEDCYSYRQSDHQTENEVGSFLPVRAWKGVFTVDEGTREKII